MEHQHDLDWFITSGQGKTIQSRRQPGIKIIRLAAPGIGVQLGMFETDRRFMGRLRIGQGNGKSGRQNGSGFNEL